MRVEIIEKARVTAQHYFGELSPGMCIAVLSSQVNAMLERPTIANLREQTGDVLFALVSFARTQGWDLEEILQEATAKVEARKANRHYYEAHVTTEPVFEDQIERFREVCAVHKFRVAPLFMQKRKEDKPERNKHDAFCTGRGISLPETRSRTIQLVADLRAAGFRVWRFKVESTILDSRYNDSDYPLDKEGMPEKNLNPPAPADGALPGRV